MKTEDGSKLPVRSADDKLTPPVIARAFVKAYYWRLFSEPSSLVNFYDEDCYVLHPCVHEGLPVFCRDEVRRLIDEHNFNSCTVRVTSIDSTVSRTSGAVLILVLGELTNQGSQTRKFVQNFLLEARHTHDGQVFHVCVSDILRYRDENEAYVPAGVAFPSETEAELRGGLSPMPSSRMVPTSESVPPPQMMMMAHSAERTDVPPVVTTAKPTTETSTDVAAKGEDERPAVALVVPAAVEPRLEERSTLAVDQKGTDEKTSDTIDDPAVIAVVEKDEAGGDAKRKEKVGEIEREEGEKEKDVVNKDVKKVEVKKSFPHVAAVHEKKEKKERGKDKESGDKDKDMDTDNENEKEKEKEKEKVDKNSATVVPVDKKEDKPDNDEERKKKKRRNRKKSKHGSSTSGETPPLSPSSPRDSTPSSSSSSSSSTISATSPTTVVPAASASTAKSQLHQPLSFAAAIAATAKVSQGAEAPEPPPSSSESALATPPPPPTATPVATPSSSSGANTPQLSKQQHRPTTTTTTTTTTQAHSTAIVSPTSSGTSTEIYVSQIPATTDDAFLQKQFSKFGKIVSITREARHSFAFIKFDSPRAVSQALDADIVAGEIRLQVEEKHVTPPSWKKRSRGAGGSGEGGGGQVGGKRAVAGVGGSPFRAGAGAGAGRNGSGQRGGGGQYRGGGSGRSGAGMRRGGSSSSSGRHEGTV